MCISPDGDFFEALRSGKGDVATGHIDTVTQRSIKLKNGKTIDDIDVSLAVSHHHVPISRYLFKSTLVLL